VLLFFIPFALVLTVPSGIFLRSSFFAFPRQRPEVWGLMMVRYPLMAAIPQELVFRVFLFARSGALFPDAAVLVIHNGISVDLAHAFYGNWIALTLSTLGGMLFAYRYHRTRSIIAAGIEHGLWGDFLFTVGIGRIL